MIDIKKVGLTALAGSLVAFSVNAVEMSVSGTSEISFKQSDGTGNLGDTTEGNPWGSNTSVKFSGSGDVGFGTATIVRTLNDGLGSALSAWTSLDMGDLGKITFDNIGGSLEGMTPYDDALPTAYEEAWNGVSSSGISGAASNDTWGYSNTFGDISVSVAHTRGGTAGTGDNANDGAGLTGSTQDLVLNYASSDIAGLTLTAGITQTEDNSGATTSADSETMMVRAVYSTGPVSVGYQMADINTGTAATASTAVEGYSIAFNVNENLSISYGRYDKELEAIGGTAAVTEESTGISAAYTSGAASFRITNNESDNDGNVVGVTQEVTEMSVVLAF
jgi:outer membrane protein OmpU